MKKNAVIFPFLMSVVLAACSSDEIDEIKPGNTGGAGYVAVNIVQSNTVGGRAASTGFEYGSAAENTAKTGLFYVFDTNGNIYGTPQTVNLTPSTDQKNNPEVERIYKAVLVIDGVSEDPKDEAKQIVCILNAPAALSSITTLANLKAEIDNYRISDDNKFIMTNSVYKDGDNEVLGAEVTADKIAASESAAIANPVDIYVERVVAKVRVHKSAGFGKPVEGNDEATAKPLVDGKEKSLKIKVTGVEIANIADESHLFKHIDGINLPWAWNDVTNKRSYWETIPAVGGVSGTDLNATAANNNDNYVQFENLTYNEIAPTDFDLDNLSFADKYIQPNTYKAEEGGIEYKTAVIVTAKLLNEDNTDADLVYIRGGYTTMAGAKSRVAAYLANHTNNYWKKISENTYSQLSEDDLVWKDKDDITLAEGVTALKDYQVVAQLATTVTDIYKRVSEDTYQPVTVAEVNNFLLSEDAKIYRAEVFNNGMCYYYVNIDQTSVANEFLPSGASNYLAGTYEGVVRNHIYDLTLNSIKGIGTPVFDPEDKIIPQKTDHDDLYFLAARVNVLAWKVASQTVDFDFGND